MVTLPVFVPVGALPPAAIRSNDSTRLAEFTETGSPWITTCASSDDPEACAGCRDGCAVSGPGLSA